MAKDNNKCGVGIAYSSKIAGKHSSIMLAITVTSFLCNRYSIAD